jgi:hypothetical protein
MIGSSRASAPVALAVAADREHALDRRAQGRGLHGYGQFTGAALLWLPRGFETLALGHRRSLANGKNNGERGGAHEEARRHGNDLQPMTSLSRGKPVFTSALDTPECDPKACASAVLRLIKLLCGYGGKEVGFKRQPGSPGKGRPICHVPIIGWGPERGRRSWQCLRRDAAQLIGTIERNSLARYLFHWRPRGTGFQSHLRAAVVGRG